jgi:hypothetical protein
VNFLQDLGGFLGLSGLIWLVARYFVSGRRLTLASVLPVATVRLVGMAAWPNLPSQTRIIGVVETLVIAAIVAVIWSRING